MQPCDSAAARTGSRVRRGLRWDVPVGYLPPTLPAGPKRGLNAAVITWDQTKLKALRCASPSVELVTLRVVV